MLIAAFLISFNTGAFDPVSLARESYKSVESYSITLRASAPGSKGDSEIIRYYYKKPGLIRMEFVKPHKGAVLVYNSSNRRVLVRPFPSMKFFVLSFDPGSRIVRSSRGHRVDESDIGTLLDAVNALKSRGKMEVVGKEILNGRETSVVSITGADGYTVDTDVNRYILYLDKDMWLPLKADAYNVDGGLIESVIMDDLRINIGLDNAFFEIK